MKALIQCTVAPATTIVGSPTAILYAPTLNHVVASSHSGTTILTMPRKKKVVISDTAATSLDMPSIFSLIENVDMGKLIEDLMKTKISSPAYRRLQKFLTKVCVSFFCFSIHFMEFNTYFLYTSHWNFLCRLERSIKRQAKGSYEN
jgi:hypothetical protein